MKSSIATLSTLILLVCTSFAEERFSVPLGREVETEGVILQKQDDHIRIRSHEGRLYDVVFGPGTEIEEKKKNPFRSAEDYSDADLVPGLNVRVKGRGDREGAVLAEEIKFTQDELKVARTIHSQITEVDQRISQTKDRLSSAENEIGANSDKIERRTSELTGQVEELESAFTVAREEAQQAQETANEALETAAATDQRVTSLDQYKEIERVVIGFGFDSTDLNSQGKQTLDRMVSTLHSRNGYLLEITGFASADGDPEYNRDLSDARADSVVRYLVETHEFPVRRLLRPYAYGELRPVADNSTIQGRQQNRRVEVRVLQSRAFVAQDNQEETDQRIAAKELR